MFHPVSIQALTSSTSSWYLGPKCWSEGKSNRRAAVNCLEPRLHAFSNSRMTKASQTPISHCEQRLLHHLHLYYMVQFAENHAVGNPLKHIHWDLPLVSLSLPLTLGIASYIIEIPQTSSIWPHFEMAFLYMHIWYTNIYIYIPGTPKNPGKVPF